MTTEEFSGQDQLRPGRGIPCRRPGAGEISTTTPRCSNGIRARRRFTWTGPMTNNVTARPPNPHRRA
jgi:hypothetical protein